MMTNMTGLITFSLSWTPGQNQPPLQAILKNPPPKNKNKNMKQKKTQFLCDVENRHFQKQNISQFNISFKTYGK